MAGLFIDWLKVEEGETYYETLTNRLDQHFSERLRALKEHDNKLKWRCVELEGMKKYVQIRLLKLRFHDILRLYKHFEGMMKRSENIPAEIPYEADGSYIASQGKFSS